MPSKAMSASSTQPLTKPFTKASSCALMATADAAIACWSFSRSTAFRTSAQERHASRFLLALGVTGTGGGDAGRRIHLVRAHRGSGIGVRCDHLDVAALLAQGLDLACQVCARKFAQALEL